MRLRLWTFVLFCVAGLGVHAANAQPPEAMCRDCRDMANRLRAAQRAHRDLLERLEEARQSRARLDVTQAMDAAERDAAAALPPTPANQDRLARLQRRVDQNDAEARQASDRIAALEGQVLSLSRTIAELAAELNGCNRGCGLAPPGTPPQPPPVVDEAVPDPACERCRPIADRIRQLQARRRQVLDERARVEGQMDAFDAALDKLQEDLRALEAKGVSANSVTVNGVSVDTFFQEAMGAGFKLAAILADLDTQWRELDAQIQAELSKLPGCEKSCNTKETGFHLSPPIYYALGGAAAGGIVIATSGDAPTSTVATTPMSTPAPTTPGTPQPAPPPPTVAPPPPTIAGVADCTRCEVMDDTGRHNLVINLCPQLTGAFEIAVASITIRHPAPFVDLVGAQYDQASGVFRGTTRGTVAGIPNVGITADGTANAATGEIRFTYTMGTGGELPGGRSITYAITLQKRR